MAWDYKGVQIELEGANFVARIDGSRMVSPSLAGTKKQVDKKLSMKAMEVKLTLPVVMIQQPRRGYRSNPKDKVTIVRRVISGLDPEDHKVLGMDAPDGQEFDNILPDTKQNEERLKALVEAKEAVSKAEAAIDGREVSLYIPSGGRNSSFTYAEAVKRLQSNYDEAKKGKCA